MTPSAVRFVAAVVRAWTCAYTWGLPAALRDARRDEIESDLWESAHDRDRPAAAAALQMVARMLIGMPDDVGWRSEQIGTRVSRRWRLALAAGAAAILTLWLVGERATSTEIPDIRQLQFTNNPQLIDAPPPPPPPPPPCPPSGFPMDPRVPCTK